MLSRLLTEKKEALVSVYTRNNGKTINEARAELSPWNWPVVLFVRKLLPYGWLLWQTKVCVSRSCVATAGGANLVARCPTLRCTAGNSAAILDLIQRKT